MMMKFRLKFSAEAKGQFLELEKSKDKFKQYKAVGKTLGLMENNLRHPSLNTHKLMLLNLLLARKFLNRMLKIKRQVLTEFFGVMAPVVMKYLRSPSLHIHKVC